MPDSCFEHRKWLKEQAYGIPPDFDSPELVYGLPSLPVEIPAVASQAQVFSLGAESAPWGFRVYTDGSGLASGTPEATRCGWSVVSLSPGGWPVKAAFGALAGPVQTVPRAERQAILHASKVGPWGLEVVSDHLSA
eukprot:5328075-Pyramimonas_sp.AAC.1